jgi:hypothetical protein
MTPVRWAEIDEDRFTRLKIFIIVVLFIQVGYRIYLQSIAHSPEWRNYNPHKEFEFYLPIEKYIVRSTWLNIGSYWFWLFLKIPTPLKSS